MLYKIISSMLLCRCRTRVWEKFGYYVLLVSCGPGYLRFHLWEWRTKLEDDFVPAGCLDHGVSCYDQGYPVFWKGKKSVLYFVLGKSAFSHTIKTSRDVLKVAQRETLTLRLILPISIRTIGLSCDPCPHNFVKCDAASIRIKPHVVLWHQCAFDLVPFRQLIFKSCEY